MWTPFETAEGDAARHARMPDRLDAPTSLNSSIGVPNATRQRKTLPKTRNQARNSPKFPKTCRMFRNF